MTDLRRHAQVIHRAADERASGGALQDNYDDADGYYKSLLGETLDGGRYHVHANVGKGMFSSVVRARDARPEKGQSDEVAIKIVRSQESMCVFDSLYVLLLLSERHC